VFFSCHHLCQPGYLSRYSEWATGWLTGNLIHSYRLLEGTVTITLWGPLKFYSVDTCDPFPGAMRPQREADLSPSFTTEFKNEWMQTAIPPYAFMACRGAFFSGRSRGQHPLLLPCTQANAEMARQICHECFHPQTLQFSISHASIRHTDKPNARHWRASSNIKSGDANITQ
jgi:hypothetical protein